MSESYKECSVPAGQECPYHPIDCPNCVNGDVCQQRPEMERHRDVIKRCRFFRPKEPRRI